MSNPGSAIAGKGQEQKGKGKAPVPIPELREDSAQVGAHDDPLRMAGGDSVPSQASWLVEGRLHSAQRHALAARIGRVQGNQHLQRVVASLNRSPADGGSRHAQGGPSRRERDTGQALPNLHPGEENAFSEDSIQRSPQAAASATGEPPPAQAVGRLGDGRWVQRGLLDEVSAAARGLYNQITGQADSAGSASQRDSQARSSELEGEATTSEAGLQADASAQSAALQAGGQASAAAVEALASAQSQGLQAQAAAGQSALQGGWAELQGKTTSMEEEVQGQAETQETDLRGDTAAFVTQVESGWTERQEQASSQMSSLEREARDLHGSSQRQAAALLANGGGTREGLTSGARTIEAGWHEFVSRLNPFRRLFDGMWDRLSGWINRLWGPLIEKARRALRWIGDKIQTVWRSVQEKWRRMREVMAGLRTRLRQMASQALTQLRARARQAWTALRERATSAWRGLKEKAQGVWRGLKSKGMSFISGLRQRGGNSLSDVLGRAASIARVLASMVRQAVSRLRETIRAAVSALRDSERSALDRIKNAGSIAYRGVKDMGTQVYQSLKTAGTQTLDLLRTVRDGARGLIRSAWEGVRGRWEALRERTGSALERALQRVRSLVTGLREQVFQPAWEWLSSRWSEFKNGTFSMLLKLVRGWNRLRSWASSAWPRARSDDPNAQSAVEHEARQRAAAPFESVFYKGRPGGTRAQDPRTVQTRLGDGRALDSSVRARMEPALGASLAHVRVHTDARSAQLSDDLNARAFAVGKHVAFASGEYRPGTLVGDALIAHEMAHVLQQGGTAAGPIQKGQVEEPALEMDADRSAIHAVASMWTGTRNALARIPSTAIPRLRSGLRLSTCRKKCPEGTPAPTVKIHEVNAPNTPSDIQRIPPRVEQEVQVDVSGWQDCMEPITLMPEGMSGVSGQVTLDGKKEREIEADGSHTIKVVGTKQTITPSGTLRLVAWLGDRRGKRLAVSNSFYVAAYPSAIGFSFGKELKGDPFEGYRIWGARYNLSFTSDSGVNSDCNETSMSEIISAGSGGTGAFQNMPVRQSTFIKTEKPQYDDHAIYAGSVGGARAKIDAAPNSTVQQDQFFRFACDRTDIKWDLHNGPVVPGSGFKISLRVSKEGGKYYMHVQKQGAENGGAGAGSVSDTGEKTVEI